MLWKPLFGTKLKGRLGLSHFTQRIIKTLCTNHIDYQLAIKELLQSIYCFHEKDYKALLVALQEGKLSLNRRKYSIQEIEDMKVTSVFKNRYSKYLRKQVLPPATMKANLEQ